jgi:CubicO group peptidase (beta-lactamase class C family)
MKKTFTSFILALTILSCKKDDISSNNNTTDAYYFPPNNNDVWETKTPLSTWDATKLDEAFAFAGSKNTYGMILLHKGKIVKEQYWNGWDKTNRYPLYSATKSIVATVVGIAQQDGLLNINDRTNKYLGLGFTSAPLAKENLITIKHQISMTTGLDEDVLDENCTSPACLKYKADAGTRWYYYNAPYRLVQDVVEAASGKSFAQYANEKLLNKIGITTAVNINYIMYCNTRDAARFGSFILRKGEWNGNQILTNQTYFNEMTNTSQPYNLSYGYLWWLNGKASTMAPASSLVFPTSLAPNAPTDMIMALGKDDKKIYVVPSLDIVVVRLGDDASGSSLLGPSSFDNELWTKFKAAFKY